MAKRILTIFLLLFLMLLAAASCEKLATFVSGSRDTRVQVLRVVDGDTIHVMLDGKKEKIRYIGMDTPETVHPRKPVQYCGREASNYNKELVKGKTVRLELDAQERDKYGRILAYVYVENGKGEELFVNAELVKAGLAVVATFPPNVEHVEDFIRLQKQARKASRGLWGEGKCEPVEP